jgi:hypothetical protein
MPICPARAMTLSRPSSVPRSAGKLAMVRPAVASLALISSSRVWSRPTSSRPVEAGEVSANAAPMPLVAPVTSAIRYDGVRVRNIGPAGLRDLSVSASRAYDGGALDASHQHQNQEDDKDQQPETTRERKQAFLDHVAAGLQGTRPVNVEQATRVVFGTIGRHVTAGQVDKVRDALPKEIQVLWLDATAC